MRLSEMRTEVTPQKINKIVESRFGFSIDYDNLTYAKAQRLARALGENITQIKKSFGAHTAEKNSKYMELMLVKEGLDKWLTSEQGLFESELGKSEAVLAAKDIVDSIQDMLEKVSKVQNDADNVMKSYEAGDEVDVTKVMLAREKSSLAFEATMQVRNKLLSAYKDIMSMPV